MGGRALSFGGGVAGLSMILMGLRLKEEGETGVETRLTKWRKV